VGTLLDAPIASPEACAGGFTNLGAAGGRICFHKNVNGMWLLKQCLAHLCDAAEMWPMAELVAAAERVDAPETLLDVDDSSLVLPGEMASRINAQLRERGAEGLEEHPSAMPHFASLIFHSLARRYATVLADVERLTGKKLKRISMVGGGSLNQFLNRLTAESTGLELSCGVAESSTIGNFAVQLATLEGERNSAARIAHWARELTSLRHC
jgi:rhamnulokinase